MEPDERPVPMLRGEKTWLRAVGKADFGDNALWVNDAEIAHFFGLKMPISSEGAAEFAQKLLSQQGRTTFSFAICLLGEERAIGNVTLRDVDRENGSAEMAIVITQKSLLGQGYGTDALNALVDFAFGEIRLERVQLHVFDYNQRAVRSYQKAGFATDAVLRRARFHHGQHHDVLEMSILREDWEALPRKRSWDYA